MNDQLVRLKQLLLVKVLLVYSYGPFRLCWLPLRYCSYSLYQLPI